MPTCFPHRASRILCMAIACIGSACIAQISPSDNQAATTRPVDDGESISTNSILDRMHTLGLELKSLRADVAMRTEDGLTGEASTRVGSFLLEKRGDADTRAHVDFERLVVHDVDGGNKVIPERIEYLLEGDWVIDRTYGRGTDDPAGRRETHRQIRKPGEKVDLLKLGEGPFPLPIGQPRDSVRAQFEVTRLPDDVDHPGLIGLELRPREDTRLARRFHQITVWVDPADAMPRVVETVNAVVSVSKDPADPTKEIVELIAGAESRQTTLSKVEINQPISDEDFKLEPIDKKSWSISFHEYQE